MSSMANPCQTREHARSAIYAEFRMLYTISLGILFNLEFTDEPWPVRRVLIFQTWSDVSVPVSENMERS